MNELAFYFIFFNKVLFIVIRSDRKLVFFTFEGRDNNINQFTVYS